MKKKETGEYGRLEEQIGYCFKNQELLNMALTHPSYRFESDEVDFDNQRLEFLGDAVLGFLAAFHLYAEFTEVDEGQLTLGRSRITSGKALAEVATRIELGDYILMGKGERQSGGASRSSILADALEALIGAAYLDGEMGAAEIIFKRLIASTLEDVPEEGWKINPKGRLQEYSQKKFKDQPVYSLVKEDGPAHRKVFTCEARLLDGMNAKGRGRSKQQAEMDAASKLMQLINKPLRDINS